MSEHDFALFLPDVHDIDDATMDAMYEAGCTDATAVLRAGRVRLWFGREAETRDDAIASAIRDVARAGFRAVIDDEEQGGATAS
jgi:hypothetical protein